MLLKSALFSVCRVIYCRYMRIWTLHPRHLDQKGLVAVWRETLLAQAVLSGRTKGYRNHPQLERFRASTRPLENLRLYLLTVLEEARRRGYSFDPARIDGFDELSNMPKTGGRIPAFEGQLDYEYRLLKSKLARRDPAALAALDPNPEPHPLFYLVPGGIESWERAKELDEIV